MHALVSEPMLVLLGQAPVVVTERPIRTPVVNGTERPSKVPTVVTERPTRVLADPFGPPCFAHNALAASIVSSAVVWKRVVPKVVRADIRR